MSEQTINLLKGDWYVVDDKYYHALSTVAVIPSKFQSVAHQFELKTKAEYEAWRGLHLCWAALAGRLKKV